MPLRICGLFWTETAEDHIMRHMDSYQVDQLIQRGDFHVFANTPGHPPHRWLFVGRAPSGKFITVILEEPEDGDCYAWKPITGWPSTKEEHDQFVQEDRRLKRKRGR